MEGASQLRFRILAAEAVQSGRRHVGLDADRHRHAAARANAERLSDNRRVGEVEAEAAIRLVIFYAENAKRAQLLEHFMRRKFFRLLPFLDERIDLILDEAGDGVAKLFVLFRELHEGFLRSITVRTHEVG